MMKPCVGTILPAPEIFQGLKFSRPNWSNKMPFTRRKLEGAGSVNTDDIQQCIPHRDPFLWLDEVTEISDTHIVARKLLSETLPVFQGHYPSFPVFPGVLQCEACFQAGAVLISRLVPAGSNDVPVVTRLNNVQFRRLIRPGETIELHVELTERLQNAFFLKGKCTVDGKVTARLEFVCASAPME